MAITFEDALRAVVAGAKMTSEPVSDGDDELVYRLQLVGYHGNAGKLQALVPHARWLIEHHPDLPYSHPFMGLGKEDAEATKPLWEAAFARLPDDVQVLKNACECLRNLTPDLDELIARGIALAPDDPYWHHRLGATRRGHARDAAGEARAGLYREASAAFERSAAMSSPTSGAYWMAQAAKCARESGDIERATVPGHARPRARRPRSESDDRMPRHEHGHGARRCARRARSRRPRAG